MANTIYTPGVQNTPFGSRNTNPEGSNYPGDSAYSPVETNLIAKSIESALFDAAPKHYAAIKILFSKPVKDVNLDEHEYLEYTFGREAVTSTTAIAAVVAVPGSAVTTTFDVSNADLNHISISDILTFADNTEAVITDITGNTVTLSSLTNSGLSAIAISDVFSIRAATMGDGQNQFDNYQRLETITRYNYVQFFLRACRWDRVEMQKYENAGTTDYLAVDKKQKIKQLRYDMFISFWNGHRGEYTLSGARVAKSMGGIYPLMQAAQSAQANPTLGGLQAAFETLALDTNFKAEGETRFIYGTHRSLHELSKVYKLSNVRYTTDTMKVNLDLGIIELGGAKYVLVPCEIWRESSCFPADWNNRLIVLDQETVQPIKMKGIPLTEMGQTDDLRKGTREQFTDWWVKGQLSLRFNNPLASFIIDIQ